MFKRKNCINRDSIDTNDSDSTIIRHKRSNSIWKKLFKRKSETEIEPERDLSSSASDLDFRAQFDAMLSSPNPWN